MYVTIADIFEQSVIKYPNKEALFDVTLNKRWTYKEWDDEVNQLANAFLEAGVKKGDRVSSFLFNRSEFATTFFACTKIGAVFNPINFRLTPKEVEYIVEDAKPKVLIFEKALESIVSAFHHQFPNIKFWYIDKDTPSYAVNYHDTYPTMSNKRPASDVSENDLYTIMYTSGTTGRPKGVMHRHRDIIDQSTIMIGALQLTPSDRGLVTAPLFHSAELHCAFLPRVHIGASNVMMHHFEPELTLKLVEEESITNFFAAPTMWNVLLQKNLAEYKLSSLQKGLYGGAPMAPALAKKVSDSFHVGLVQAYGMTEMGPAITLLMDEEHKTKSGSAGKALINHEIRVVRTKEDDASEPDETLPPGEKGEIIVKGPCMMIGYYNNEEATEKAMYKGWYHSGDIGYFDEEGYLWVADRLDDMIVSGGENIYPREVEDVLYEHSGIIDVAVIGEPDELWGRIVVAYVVKKDESLTAEALDHLCKTSDKLADYKRPRQYVFVDELPRNASGKLQKFRLRK